MHAFLSKKRFGMEETMPDTKKYDRILDALHQLLEDGLKKASEELRHACRIMAMRVKGEISVCPARVLAVFNGFS